MFGIIIKHTTDLYALCLYAPFVIWLHDAGKKETKYLFTNQTYVMSSRHFYDSNERTVHSKPRTGKKLFYFQTFHLQNIQIDDSPDFILQLTLGLKFICFTYNAKQNIKLFRDRKIPVKLLENGISKAKTRQIYPVSKKDLIKKKNGTLKTKRTSLRGILLLSLLFSLNKD